MPGLFTFRRLSFKLALGICAVLIPLVLLFSYQQYRLHKSHLIEGLKISLTHQGQLIEKALEYGMLEGHGTLVQEMVGEMAAGKGVESILILNKKGVVKASSRRQYLGKRLNPKGPTCRICHLRDKRGESRTVVYQTGAGEEVFRNVIAIANQKKCHSCHNPRSRINGVLIIDYSLSGINQRLRSDMWKRAGWAAGMLAAILLVLTLLANRMVLRKIRILERASKRVEQGYLDQHLEVRGEDELSYLARHFNSMTSSLRDSMKRLEGQKAYLEKLINSLDDHVVVIDRDFRIVLANQAYLSRVEGGLQEAEDRYCYSITHMLKSPCDDASFQCPARITFERSEPSRAIHCIQAEDGSKQYWEIYASPVRDEQGRVTQVVEVMRDITERRRLEERLSHSERLASLGLMASGISHEINNPLASITTCLDGLRRRMQAKAGGECDEIGLYLDLIRKEIGRCREITQRLLTLSEKPKANLDPFDVNTALQETLSLLSEQAEARAIRITTDLSDQVNTILADGGQIRQVFWNILLNAMEATEKGGMIDVSTCRNGQRVLITVADNGKGIAEEDLRQVFQPFFSKKKGGERGSGLGLTICESIIRRHKGDISIRSVSGKGTTVRIELPVNPDTATSFCLPEEEMRP